jgi:hypothetical protein
MKGRLERDIKLNMFMTKAKNLLSQIDDLADSLDVRQDVILVNIVSVIRDFDEDEQANIEAMYLFNVADSQEMFDMMSHAVEVYEKESKDTKKNNRLSATDDLFDGFISLN